MRLWLCSNLTVNISGQSKSILGLYCKLWAHTKSQPAIACSKLTKETQEKDVKYVQS